MFAWSIAVTRVHSQRNTRGFAGQWPRSNGFWNDSVIPEGNRASVSPYCVLFKTFPQRSPNDHPTALSGPDNLPWHGQLGKLGPGSAACRWRELELGPLLIPHCLAAGARPPLSLSARSTLFVIQGGYIYHPLQETTATCLFLSTWTFLLIRFIRKVGIKRFIFHH